jgi:hypothetical protein
MCRVIQVWLDDQLALFKSRAVEPIEKPDPLEAFEVSQPRNELIEDLHRALHPFRGAMTCPPKTVPM